MSFDSGFGSSSSSSKGSGKDAEMQAFAQEQMAIAQIKENIAKMTEVCWNVCVDKPKDRFDGRTESCLSNCVERNIDCALFISNRYMKKLQGHT